MSDAELSRFLFLAASIIVSVVAPVVAIFFYFENRKPLVGLNAYNRGNRILGYTSIVAAIVLTPLFGFGAYHVYHLTPEQFVTEFNLATRR